MKIRLYLNDFTLCADIDWNSPILPQKGDMILLQEFINLEKKTTNMLHFVYIPNTCNVMKVYVGYHMTREQVEAVKKMKEVIISSSIIWRIINKIQTPCYIVKAVSDHGIIDAYFVNEQID